LILLALGSSIAAPQVEWVNQRADLRVAPDQEEITAEFRFKNVGDANLKIGNVKSSCGCTVATLEKGEYAPGESGAVRAIFTIGSRLGEQEKVIQVDTNDEKQPKAYLTLHVSIPATLELKPPMISWDRDEPLKPKKVRATILKNAPIKQITATSSDQSLDVQVMKVVGSDKQFDIVVSPPDGEKRIRAVVTITADWPANKPKKYSLCVIAR
jgi:hypothetical protein